MGKLLKEALDKSKVHEIDDPALPLEEIAYKRGFFDGIKEAVRLVRMRIER